MLALLRGSEASLLRDALELSTPSDAARVRAFWDTAGAELLLTLALTVTLTLARTLTLTPTRTRTPTLTLTLTLALTRHAHCAELLSAAVPRLADRRPGKGEG